MKPFGLSILSGPPASPSTAYATTGPLTSTAGGGPLIVEQPPPVRTPSWQVASEGFWLLAGMLLVSVILLLRD